jgi:hypothetical protein
MIEGHRIRWENIQPFALISASFSSGNPKETARPSAQSQVFSPKQMVSPVPPPEGTSEPSLNEGSPFEDP